MESESKKPESASPVDGRVTTELRVQITEEANGNLNVQWAATVKDSTIAIPMRPSHVIGQLQAAIAIIAQRTYAGKS